MANATTMQALYKKLKKLGLNQKCVRELGLPTWWNDELDHSPAAVLEGAGHIAARLNLDLNSLLDSEKEASFKQLPQEPKFKFQQQHEKEIPQVARYLASNIAKIIGTSINLEFKDIPDNPVIIRNQILEKHPQVNLNSLLGYCWSRGIAVVYFNKYPKQERKIDGMIQWVDQHPVIVLSSGKTHPATLAFHLAHEVGHLALGHLKDGILLEGDLNKKSNQIEECESNYFAAQLLLGKYDGYLSRSSFRNAYELKSRIEKIINQNNSIDPCALALNYAWHSGKFPQARKAINLLNSNDNGHKAVNQELEKKINWSRLTDDQEDYLETIVEE